MATIDEILSILLASKTIPLLPTAGNIQPTDWRIVYNNATQRAEKQLLGLDSSQFQLLQLGDIGASTIEDFINSNNSDDWDLQEDFLYAFRDETGGIDENDLNDSLIAYYKFNEIAGTTSTDEVGNNNGTIVNAEINQTGLIDKCYRFNNGVQDQYIDIADSDDFSFTDGVVDVDFSINLHLKTLATFGEVVSKYNTTTGDVEWRVFFASGKLTFIIYSESDVNNYFWRQTDATLTLDTWYNISITKVVGVAPILKLDDVIQTAGGEQGTYVKTSNTNAIVRVAQESFNDAGGNRYVGYIDILRIWKGRVLTDTNLTTIYNAGAGLENNYIAPTPSVTSNRTWFYVGTQPQLIGLGNTPVTSDDFFLIPFTETQQTFDTVNDSGYDTPVNYTKINDKLAGHIEGIDNALGSVGTHEGYNETGTRAGGDLITINGDYDDSGNGTKIIIDDDDESITITKSLQMLTGVGISAAGISIEQALGSSNTGSILPDNLTGPRVYQLHNDSGEFLLDASTQTITNKTIDADTNTIQNIGFAEFDVDTGDTMGFVNCNALDASTLLVTSNGTIITASMEKLGGGDIRIVFSTGVSIWDATPASTVALTEGSDSSPQVNYVFYDETDSTFKANTTGFTTTEFLPVATVYCQSAASLQIDGAYKVHKWTDAVTNVGGQGHLSHLNSWIRSRPAGWLSGVATSTTVGINIFTLSTTSGIVKQLHDHSFPARTTPTDPLFIVNDFTTAFKRETVLTNVLTDSLGNSMSNTRFNLVIWGSVNEVEGDSKVFMNLSSGSYTKDQDAIDDINKYSNFNIPSAFTGTGFLIARLTVRHIASSNTWSILQTEDLRGQFPSTTAGGTATTSTEFSDNAFKIFNVADDTKEIVFDASGISTGNVRAIIMPDHDVDLVNVRTNTTIIGTGATTINLPLYDIINFQFGAFNEIFTFTVPAKPSTFIIKLVQDGVGSRTATFPATVKWVDGTAPILTTTSTTGTDIITFYYDGTNYFGVQSLNFS